RARTNSPQTRARKVLHCQFSELPCRVRPGDRCGRRHHRSAEQRESAEPRVNAGEDSMIKGLLAAVAAVGLMSRAASAQTYIPMWRPPAAPPSVGVPGSTTTTTTTSPTTDHRTEITKGVDANGNEITKKDTIGMAWRAAAPKATRQPSLTRMVGPRLRGRRAPRTSSPGVGRGT